MRFALLAVSALALSAAPLLAQEAPPAVPKPAALVADGIPAVPQALAAASRPYMEFRTATFLDWDPATRAMLVSTRFGNVGQLHTVAGPLMMRRQISFEAEPLGGVYAPNDGTLVVSKDTGGSEFFQLYTLRNGRLTLLTDGKSRNEMGPFSHDGKWLAYSSTRRNGSDADLYVIDPRDPSSNRLVAQVKGGGWGIADFAPDGNAALVMNFLSVAKVNLHWLDLASGKMTPIGDHKRAIAYRSSKFAPDGTLWVTSDEGSDFLRLGTLDLKTGKFTPRGPETRWDVESLDIAADGSFIAYTVNEAGVSKLRLLDPKSGAVREVAGLPKGVIAGFDIAP